MTKEIYLAGGYFTNANYGDVIQARAWIDFYARLGFKVSVLYAGAPDKTVEFRHYLGEHPRLVPYTSILERKTVVDSQDVFHLYGGGYLNSVWGGEFSKLLQVFAQRKAKVISTGTQVDRTWARNYRHDLRDVANVHWLSVRDKYSRKYLNTNRPLLCDDSFLYFLDSGRQPPSQSAKPKHILAHFNISDYAVKHFSDRRQPLFYKVLDKLKGRKELNSVIFEDFVRNYLRQGYQITILRNFPNMPDDVIEAERVFANRDLLLKIKLKETFAAEQEGSTYQFGIANSFHAAILIKVWFNTPVYFLALNNYYEQKSAALLEYGVVDKKHLITSMNQLSRFSVSEAELTENKEVLRRMSKRVEALKRAVLEVVNT